MQQEELAVLFCPFCGKKEVTSDTLKKNRLSRLSSVSDVEMSIVLMREVSRSVHNIARTHKQKI